MKTRSTWERNYADISSGQVVERVRDRTIIWPIGSVEQHGPHLPLSVDSVISDALARQIAYELDGYRLPVLSIAARSLPQSGGGLSFPGTLYARGDVVIQYLRDVIRSLVVLPFRRLIVLNGHFENESLIFEAVDEARQQGLVNGKEIIAFSWWSLVTTGWLTAEAADFPGWHAEHAGLTETSLMLFLRPDLVSDGRPDHDRPPGAGVYLHPIDVAQTTNNGVLSSTSGSSAELGEKLFWHVVSEAVALVRNGHGLVRGQEKPMRALTGPGHD